MTLLARFLVPVLAAVACAVPLPALAATADPLPDLVVRSVRLEKMSDAQTTLDFVVTNVGKGPSTELFAIAIAVDGKIFRHTFYRQKDRDPIYGKQGGPVIPLGARQSHRFAVGGFAEIAKGRHRISVTVDRLDTRDPAAAKALGDYRHNAVRESREYNNRAVLLVR